MELLFLGLVLAVLQYLGGLLIEKRLEASLQRETNAALEQLRWDLKVREQATRVAEYMALARTLTADSQAEDYRAANRLAWELAMWLPSDVYRSLTLAMTASGTDWNPLSVTIAVRHLLLGNAAGDLTPDDVLHHSPGVGGHSSHRE